MFILNDVKINVHNKRPTTKLIKYINNKKINKLKYHKNK